MRLIKQSNLEKCLEKHTDARVAVANWVAMVKAARWTCADDAVRSSTVRTRAIPNGRLVFNIKGNDYRLICAAVYAVPGRSEGILMLKFFGTHADYDKIDPETVEQRW